jgi:uncharacterized membrane protein
VDATAEAVRRAPAAPAGRDGAIPIPRTGRRISTTATVVYSITAAYALVFALAAAARHLEYRSAMLDLGDMTQAVWSTAHGHFLAISTASGDQISRLAVHVDPFLALLAPLWWVWPSPLMLLTLQAIAVSSGALPVFWLARKHLRSERAAAHFALAYLIFPAVQFNVFSPAVGMHPASFAIPLILYSLWFLDGDRLLPFLGCAFLAATTKEQMPLVVGCLGLWYALERRRPIGLAIFGTGLLWTSLNFFVVIPHFAPAGFHPFADRYGPLGGSPGAVLRTVLTDPIGTLGTEASTHKLAYLLLLFVPFLGLWALRPLLALCALPQLGLNLLSSYGPQTTVFYQYTAGIVPFVVAASVLGAARLRRDPARTSLYVLVATGCLAILSPLVVGARDLGRVLPSNPDHTAVAAALRLVPPRVSVSASQQLGAYLAERPRIMVFPHVRGARWLVVDEHDPTYTAKAPFRRALTAVRESPSWRLVYSKRGIDVFRR